MSKEFKKYISGNKEAWFILTFIMGALVITFFISALMGNNVKYPGLIIFIGIMLLSLIPIWRKKKFFKNLEADELLCSQIEADFKTTISKRKDKIRFGEKWIYIKHSSKLLKYEDIKQVYQYIHRTNFIENERSLKYVDTRGKHRKLCNLELRDKSRDEMMQIIAIILEKNPTVKIGYR